MKPKKRIENNDIKILIVEDSPTQAEQLKHSLEKGGYTVSAAANGKQALAAMQERKPTLVISDIVMPEMNGYELCRQIRADVNFKDIPVVLLTALSDPTDIIKGLECGANNFFTKPFDKKSLLFRIHQVIANLKLRKEATAEIGISIFFRKKRYFISAERLQILDLLLGTYETAVEQNCKLRKAQDELKSLNEQLEQKVEERTARLSAEIVEHKRAEEARKHLEDELKNYAKDLEKKVEERTNAIAGEKDKIDGILKSMADGLLVTDLKHRVLLINPALESLLEVKAEEVIGCQIWERIKNSKLKKIIRDTLSKKESGDTVDFEMEDPASKRTKILQARTAVVHDSSGKPFGTVTIMHDITRECEIDKLKSEFLSTAAHELRTPLTVIQGFSYILATRKDLDEKRKQHFLKLINDESGHLAKIISDLLDISRIESGRGLEIHKENINLSEIVHKTVMSFKETSPEHEFILICPPDAEKCQVFADKAKISQVVINILNNAIKYSPEGGKITTSGKKLKDKMRVSIKDEGIGIAEKDIPHIFDKFHRVNNLTTRKVEGTGLGLSIVKYIVEQHGGSITVESTLGEGSTFSVILPLMEQVRN